MIRDFADEGTEDIYYGRDTKLARSVLPRDLHRKARVKLTEIDYASVVEHLKVPPGNRLEALKGDRAGQWSIRINDKYRICFLWSENRAHYVQIVDYH